MLQDVAGVVPEEEGEKSIQEDRKYKDAKMHNSNCTFAGSDSSFISSSETLSSISFP